MDNCIIAVVIPVYNGEHELRKSLYTLLRQTFSDWVCIIINDGSTDRTSFILEEFALDDRFIIINLKDNKGRGMARKLGLEKVREINAKYMCMLDVGDYYYTNKLEWQFDYMENNRYVSLTSCNMGYIDNNLNLLGVQETVPKQQFFSFDNYSQYTPVPHASSIIRVSDIGDITFDEDLKLGQDQDFMRKMLINKKYAYVPQISYLYNRGDSFSVKKYRKSLEYTYLSYKKLGADFFFLLKKYLEFKCKILIISLLAFFKKKDIYFERIGRVPNNDEIIFHNEFLRSISQ